MKKLIALLIAVSSLAMSTSALAFTVHPVGSGTGASRNYYTGNDISDGSDAFVSGEATGTADLPTYRNGDEITFEVKGTEVVNNATLTFICSKIEKNGAGYTNENVQMVDQVQLDASNNTASCTYKLRSNLTDGLYKLEIRIGDAVPATFSFLIGTPSVELLYVKAESERTKTAADKYILKHGDAYCFGKATITGGANFSQTGTEFGFIFDKDNNGSFDVEGVRMVTDFTNKSFTAQEALSASIDHNGTQVKQEIGGEANYFFRMVLENVYEHTFAADGTEVKAELDEVIFAKLPDVDVFLDEWNN